MNELRSVEVQKLEEFLLTCSAEDLAYLNHLIVARLNLLSRIKAQNSMAKLYPGLKVTFTDNEGNPLKGTVMKMNVKTVSVVTDEGKRWNVAPVFLTPLG